MTSILSCQNVTLTLDRALIVEGLDFSAQKQELIGLVGPNGAGKSTLVRALAGVLAPAKGRIFLNDKDVYQTRLRERARTLSYLPQQPDVHWDMSIETVIALGRFAYGETTKLSSEGKSAIDGAISKMDLEDLRHRRASTLSGGEQARMHMARTLASGAPLIIADEPVTALDPKYQLSVMSALHEHTCHGGTCIVAIHDLRLARQFCTRIMVLSEQSLVLDGTPDDILETDALADIYSLNADDMALFTN
ncbi:MAG: ABC transporter ATP-binding protein [Pseudomonadota bacterium]